MNYAFLFKSVSFKRNIIKNLNYKTVTSLKGFRFLFSGRFSREQIAKHIIIQEGRVPLSSIDSIIDFSFFIIPLENSTVCIKIWLCNSFKYNKFYFKIV